MSNSCVSTNSLMNSRSLGSLNDPTKDSFSKTLQRFDPAGAETSVIMYPARSDVSPMRWLLTVAAKVEASLASSSEIWYNGRDSAAFCTPRCRIES